MASTLLDLNASNLDAKKIRTHLINRASERLESAGVVSPEFLDEMRAQHPVSILWSKIALDEPLKSEQTKLLNPDTIRSFLSQEATSIAAFNYKNSQTLMKMFDWELTEKPAVNCDVDLAQKKIEAALELIAQIWPEGYQNMRLLTQGVMWFQSNIFYNFSNALYFGSIFFRPDVRDRTILDIATLLIHEAAHHVIFIELFRDPLIIDDPTKTVYSPLRRTQRPIHGVFQSQAALLRMIVWLHHVLEHEDVLDAAMIEEAKKESVKLQEQLLQVTDGMKDIKYSPRGQAIYEDYRFVCDNL